MGITQKKEIHSYSSQHYVTVDMDLKFDNMNSMVGFKAYDFLYEFVFFRQIYKVILEYTDITTEGVPTNILRTTSRLVREQRSSFLALS